MLDAETGRHIGKVLSGQEDGVNIRPHLEALTLGRRHVQVHSHPGSSAFSDADAAILRYWPDIHAVVVVGVDGGWYALSRAIHAVAPGS